MKKVLFTLVCLIVASLSAQAQYVPDRITLSKGNLCSETGAILSDQDVLAAIGQEIYDETYVGARKQYRTGGHLMLGGGIAAGVGLAVTTVSAIVLANWLPIQKGEKFNFDDPQYVAVASSSAGVSIGAAVMTAGLAALSAGIVFRSIGNGRLKWIAKDYNARNGRPVEVAFDNGQYGTGLILRF